MSQEQTESRSPQRQGQEDNSRGLPEWVTLGISSAIILVLIGLVIFHGLHDQNRPPLISVQPRLEAVREADGYYYVPVDISNHGDQTVEELRVAVELPDTEPPESSILTIHFLAGGATKHGTAVFKSDPRTGILEVDILSFLDP